METRRGKRRWQTPDYMATVVWSQAERKGLAENREFREFAFSLGKKQSSAWFAVACSNSSNIADFAGTRLSTKSCLVPPGSASSSPLSPSPLSFLESDKGRGDTGRQHSVAAVGAYSLSAHRCSASLEWIRERGFQVAPGPMDACLRCEIGPTYAFVPACTKRVQHGTNVYESFPIRHRRDQSVSDPIRIVPPGIESRRLIDQLSRHIAEAVEGPQAANLVQLQAFRMDYGVPLRYLNMPLTDAAVLPAASSKRPSKADRLSRTLATERETLLLRFPPGTLRTLRVSSFLLRDMDSVSQTPQSNRTEARGFLPTGKPWAWHASHLCNKRANANCAKSKYTRHAIRGRLPKGDAQPGERRRPVLHSPAARKDDRSDGSGDRAERITGRSHTPLPSTQSEEKRKPTYRSDIITNGGGAAPRLGSTGGGPVLASPNPDPNSNTAAVLVSWFEGVENGQNPTRWDAMQTMRSDALWRTGRAHAWQPRCADASYYRYHHLKMKSFTQLNKTMAKNEVATLVAFAEYCDSHV
ncbi:hypothetical protein CMUS01_08556 [Colletotrichum musicola]|uniref:Uncharacterized protein n=1 Tax=Colletotrichum musicola TaxID=2175873 RepID=A0A8H6NCI5_9PEZI|nr:hypothetical protein CMUS01_08556 [Colletotrichum musicola]